MKFEPIDIKKHRDYIILFRRDSFVVSFGTDEEFGDEEEYLNWIKASASEFPDGFVMAWEDEIPIGQIELTIRKYEGRLFLFDEVNKMKTITICGSMKFAEEMKQIAWRLEVEKGFNVLQCIYNEQNEPITDEAQKRLVASTFGSLCSLAIYHKA